MTLKEYLENNKVKRVFRMDICAFLGHPSILDFEVVAVKGDYVFVDEAGLQPFTYSRFRSIIDFDIKTPLYYSDFDIQLDSFIYELGYASSINHIYISGSPLPNYLIFKNIYVDENIFFQVTKKMLVPPDVNIEFKELKYDYLPPLQNFKGENYLVSKILEEAEEIENNKINIELNIYQSIIFSKINFLIQFNIILLLPSYFLTNYGRTIMMVSMFLVLVTMYLIYLYFYPPLYSIKGIKFYRKGQDIYAKLKKSPIKLKGRGAVINPAISLFKKSYKLDEKLGWRKQK